MKALLAHALHDDGRTLWTRSRILTPLEVKTSTRNGPASLPAPLIVVSFSLP